MATLDLSKYGIKDVKEVLHNPSYDVLFAEETKPGLEGFEKGQVTELGAVNVMTGVYTGRSPKDKFFVKNEASENSVWWTSEEYKNDNKPCSEEAWADLKAKAVKELSGKRLFVVDTFCGANEATRMKVRFIIQAGGFASDALKSKAYIIYMNGKVAKLSHGAKVQPGSEIVIPTKLKRKMSTAEMMSMGSSMSSIAAMIATIANLSK